MDPMIVDQELLARSVDENRPLSQQEYYELRIEESDDAFRPGFVVKQTHAAWNAFDNQIMFDAIESERWPTFRKARERCEVRRNVLRGQGFDHSDMELF